MNEDEFRSFIQTRGLQLTNEQWTAVTANNDALAIYAGPGSGKTTVLTLRVAYLHLIRGIAPEQIVVVTFTRKSARELQERLERLLPALKHVIAGTFHSLFLRWLLRYKHINPQLLSAQEQHMVITSILMKLHIPDAKETCNQYIQGISRVKNQVHSINPQVFQTEFERTLEIVLTEYEKIKQKQERFDYDDILVTFYQAVEQDAAFRESIQTKISMMMIDEFQDTSHIQWLSIKTLCELKIPITVVGDDDQSIYRFRSAKPNILRIFEHSFPHSKAIILQHNFRSTDPIIRLSTQVIIQSTGRRQKSFVGVIGSGANPVLLRCASEWEEADKVATHIAKLLLRNPTRSIAVLARTNRQLVCLSDALQRKGTQYTTSESQVDLRTDYVVQRFLCVLRAVQKSSHADIRREALLEYSKWHTYSHTQPSVNQASAFDQFIDEIRDLSAQIAIQRVRAIYDPYVMRSRMKRGKSDDPKLDRLQLLTERIQDDQSLLEWLDNELAMMTHPQFQLSKQSQIQLLTFHGAKGLEFDDVFLIGLHDRAVPHPRATEDATTEKERLEVYDEERRLLYVGLTRARYRIFLSYSHFVLQHHTNLTPYLKEIISNTYQKTAPVTEEKSDTVTGAIPTTDDVVVHKIFGRGVVISVESMQNETHKICIMFNGRDHRCFYWEILEQLGHLSVNADRGKGIQQ